MLKGLLGRSEADNGWNVYAYNGFLIFIGPFGKLMVIYETPFWIVPLKIDGYTAPFCLGAAQSQYGARNVLAAATYVDFCCVISAATSCTMPYRICSYRAIYGRCQVGNRTIS